MTGYVYVIKTVHSCKIGKTTDPEARVSALLGQIPFQGEVAAMIESDDHHSLERALHEKYHDKRVHGEWFNLSLQDIEDLKNTQSRERAEEFMSAYIWQKRNRVTVTLTEDSVKTLDFIKTNYCSVPINDDTAFEAALLHMALIAGYHAPGQLTRHNLAILDRVQQARIEEARAAEAKIVAAKIAKASRPYVKPTRKEYLLMTEEEKAEDLKAAAMGHKQQIVKTILKLNKPIAAVWDIAVKLKDVNPDEFKICMEALRDEQYLSPVEEKRGWYYVSLDKLGADYG